MASDGSFGGGDGITGRECGALKDTLMGTVERGLSGMIEKFEFLGAGEFDGELSQGYRVSFLTRDFQDSRQL